MFGWSGMMFSVARKQGVESQLFNRPCLGAWNFPSNSGRAHQMSGAADDSQILEHFSEDQFLCPSATIPFRSLNFSLFIPAPTPRFWAS